MQSETPSAERIAGTDIAAVETGAEPAHALLAGAMGEGIGYGIAGALLGQGIVADGGGGGQTFLHVAFLQDAEALLGVIGPDSGITIGLQFGAHRAAFGARILRPAPLHRAQQVLDVVPILMG